MAERKKIKYKQKELDFTDLMYNIGNNLTKYQEHEKFSEDLLNEFNTAYKSYIDLWKANPENIYINDMGLFVGPGVIATENFYYDSDGNKINQAQYDELNSNKLKKYKKFNAGEEVVRYFNIIGNSSKEYEEPKKASFSDNDFWTEWKKEYDPDGGEYNTFSFVNQDAYDETTGTRLRTNRKSKISEFLNNYINKDFSNVDFSTTSFENSEDYVKALNSFKEILNNESSNWNDIVIAALKAGIGLDMFNHMMSDQQNPGKSPEEIEAERLAKEEELKKADAELARLEAELVKELKEAAYKKWVEDLYNLFSNNTPNSFTLDFDVNTIDYIDLDGNFDREKWGKRIYGKNYNNITAQTMLEDLYNVINNNQNLQNYKNAYHFLNYAINSDKQNYYPVGDEGFYYIPSENDKNNTIMLFNPTTGRIKYTFIGDNELLWNLKKQDWNNTYDKIPEYHQYLKKGGIINKFQNGSTFEYNPAFDLILDVKERAKQSGKSVEQLLKEEEDIGGEYGKFGPEEYARVAAMAMDLASAISGWFPGYGTIVSGATGIGSTLTNFGTDILDGTGVEWRDFGNLVFNLGTDLYGLIPGVGASGKMSKIVRNATKLAPYVLNMLGGVSLLQQGPEMILAWSKVGKEPLTTEDLNLMSQSLKLVLGQAGAAGKRYRGSEIKGLGDDKIAVTFLDKNGSKKTAMFEGEDAKKIRTATDKTAAIEDVKNQYKDLRNLTISTRTAKERNWHVAPNNDGSKSSFNPSKWRFSETKEYPLVQNVEVIAPYGNIKKKGFYVLEDNNYVKAEGPGKKATKPRKKSTSNKKLSSNTQNIDNSENISYASGEYYKQGGSLDLKKVRKGYVGLSLRNILSNPTLPNKQKTYEEVRSEVNSLNFDEHLDQVLNSMSNPPKNFFGSSSLKENGSSDETVSFINSATRATNNEQNSKSFDAKLGNLFGDIDYNALNFVANNFFNKKIYDEHLSAQIPNLESYDNRPTSVIMGNDADIQGRLAAEQLSFSKPISSDINVNTADRLSRAVQGVNLINQGNLNYDASVKDSLDRIAQELLRNYDINREIANKNRTSLLQTSSNKSNINVGYYSSLYHNLDRFLKERQTKQEKQQLLENSFIEQEIDNSVRYNLETLVKEFGSDITPEELAIYNKVLTGAVLPADLKDEELKLFRSAMLKAQDIKTQMLKKQIKVPNGYYSDLAKYSGVSTLFDPEMSYGNPVKFGKSGGKLSNDNIKLFYKQLKEESKKHEKRLNKLEKNMYRLKNSK